MDTVAASETAVFGAMTVLEGSVVSTTDTDEAATVNVEEPVVPAEKFEPALIVTVSAADG